VQLVSNPAEAVATVTTMDMSASGMPWYVVLTKPRQELVARDNLVRQGFEVYLPKLKVLKRLRGRQVAKLEPFFPRYLFIQPSSTEHSISPVRSTLGVTTLVRFGYTLAIARTETIKRLREFEFHQNQDRLEVMSPFQPGVKVMVADGPLAGLEGLISSTAQERIVVLMQLLGQDTRVTMSHHQLRVMN